MGDARVWVLPNTSGLNANHRPADFAKAFAALGAFRRSLRAFVPPPQITNHRNEIGQRERPDN